MKRAIYAMPGNESLAARLAAHDNGVCLALTVHRFPDGESLVRVTPPPVQADAVLVCTLDRPDAKLVPLLMAAATLRELGAARVGLAAPYLAYMRQDARFHPGEAVSSRIFGRMLDTAFDWLVTVDPHLHRHHSLAEAGMKHGRVVHAAARLAAWIREQVPHPLILGPDGESAQWAREVATLVDAPVLVAAKERFGDREVQVSLPDLSRWSDRHPVLIDDIIASGQTLLESIRLVRQAGMLAPWCVAVHGLLAADALSRLHEAGARGVVTTNCIPGDTAVIDISEDLAAAFPAALADVAW